MFGTGLQGAADTKRLHFQARGRDAHVQVERHPVIPISNVERPEEPSRSIQGIG